MTDPVTPSIVDPADQPAPTPQPAVPTAPDYTSALAGIVNKEGTQKYSNVDDALASINHKDTHISTLEVENAKLREAAAKTETAQEILDRLSAKSEPAAEPAAPVLDDATIANAVNAALTAREKADQVKRNKKQVADKMLSKYGDKAKVDEAMAVKAGELGVGIEFMISLASQSPAAILHHFGIDSTESTPSVQKLHSSVTPETFKQPVQSEKKFKMNGSTTQQMRDEWNRHRPES